MKPADEEFRRNIRWVQMSHGAPGGHERAQPGAEGRRSGGRADDHPHRREKEEALAQAAKMFQRVGVPGGLPEPLRLRAERWHAPAGGHCHGAGDGARLIVLDEPTSALDVLTQANIFNVLKRIKQRAGNQLHPDHPRHRHLQRAGRPGGGDVRRADRGGERRARFFTEPLHPYSQMLMASVPRLRAIRSPSSSPASRPACSTRPPAAALQGSLPQAL
jgi:peptide/nickel transport system ATP-binding protein